MDFSEWKVVQEQRDKSVLRGFSTTGGLWTVFGGIFSICFGSSILQVMFGKLSTCEFTVRFLFLTMMLYALGVKPLSVFGLVHNVQKNRIRDACLKDYPCVSQDINRVPQKYRGLNSFLTDYLINVEPFIDDEDESIGDETRVDDNQIAMQPLPIIPPPSPLLLDRPESA
jgi:hypothetical protein